MEERLNLREERDLGSVLQAGSQFLKENFVALLKTTMPLALVPIILGAGAIGTFYSNMFSSMDTMSSDPMAMYGEMSTGFLSLFGGYFLVGLAFMLLYASVAAYMKHYAAGETDITLSTVMPEVRAKALLMIFGGMLTVIIVYIGMLLCVFPGIYLSVVFSNLFLIAIIEDKGYGESFGRCFALIKDNWWSTFGIYFITGLICSAISSIIIIPFYAVMFGTMIMNPEQGPEAIEGMMSFMAILVPVFMLLYMIITLVYVSVGGVHYFSLVEKKDGTGELETIEALGADKE